MGVTVKEDLKNYGQYSKYLIYLYEVFSNEVFPEEIIVPNVHWSEFIDYVYRAFNQETPEKIVQEDLISHTDTPLQANKAIVCFSGGKDSLAQLLVLMDKGIDCTLIHLKGLNRAYYNETNVSLNIANKLGVDIEVIPFSRKGKEARMENPVKNSMAFAFLVDYMIKNNITYATAGLHTADTLQNTSAEYGLSDDVYLAMLMQKAVRYTFPSFNFFFSFLSISHSLPYLINYYYDKLPLYQSCMLPDMYRNSVRKAVEKKYNVTLLENRCLACRKCCLEYILLVLFKKVPVNKELLNKCYKQLRKDVISVVGTSNAINGKTADLKDVLNTFFELDLIQKYSKNPNEILKDIEWDSIQKCINGEMVTTVYGEEG